MSRASCWRRHLAVGVACLASLPAGVHAQDAGATLDVVPIQSEASEITWDPGLILEAKIVPHALFRSPGGRLAVEVTPKVVLRIFDRPSQPVRSPSFMPRVTFYLARDLDWRRDSGEPTTFYSFLYTHHSNGEVGDFYNEDGEINLVDGSFSTNYFDLGMHRVLPSVDVPVVGPSIAILGLSFEQHIPGVGQTDQLPGLYSDTRFHLHFDSYRSSEHGSVNLSGRLSYLAGELRDEPVVSRERFIVDLQVQVRVPWFRTAGFFLGLYAGEDYYNMRFTDYLFAPRVGLAFDFANWGPVG